jgi:hypothetical protein
MARRWLLLGSGATLGAIRMNDLLVLRTDMNSGQVHTPRSRTDLNGSGCRYGYLRIRRLSTGFPG